MPGFEAAAKGVRRLSTVRPEPVEGRQQGTASDFALRQAQGERSFTTPSFAGMTKKGRRPFLNAYGHAPQSSFHLSIGHWLPDRLRPAATAGRRQVLRTAWAKSASGRERSKRNATRLPIGGRLAACSTLVADKRLSLPGRTGGKRAAVPSLLFWVLSGRLALNAQAKRLAASTPLRPLAFLPVLP